MAERVNHPFGTGDRPLVIGDRTTIAADSDRAVAMVDMCPRLSVVIEWENARLSEAERAYAMLRELSRQLEEVAPGLGGQPEVIVLYDEHEIGPTMVEAALREAFPSGHVACLRAIPTMGLNYYEQKNRGAAEATGDVVVFLDSDVIPEPGWLSTLLGALEDPRVGVVCGNTYLATGNLYEKAMALFWYFPLRARGDELRPSRRFWANNVAFRRQQFLDAGGFPPLDQFRGQCELLAETLMQSGIGIYRAEAAQVSHPPPNGLRHFIHRALSEGSDRLRTRAALGAQRQGAFSMVRDFVSDLKYAQWRIRTRREDVQLTLPGAAVALGIAGTYHSLKLVGGLISLRWPAFVPRHFPI